MVLYSCRSRMTSMEQKKKEKEQRRKENRDSDTITVDDVALQIDLRGPHGGVRLICRPFGCSAKSRA